MSKKVSKNSEKGFRYHLLVLVVIVVFVGIRLVHLPEVINFGTDAGRDFLTTYNMFVNKNIVVLGPPSQYTVDGRAFFFGPAPYYLILPALLVGNWDPLAVSYYLILLNLAALLVCLHLLRTQVKDPWVLVLFAFFCTLTPAVIAYTRNYWNPHFMFAVSLLLLPLLLATSKKHGNYYYGLLGFLFGLGLQFHYSFIFAIIIGIGWMLGKKSLHMSSLFAIGIGFVVGFLPIIAYELKTNFYNIRTLIIVFTSPASSQNQLKINGLYYFISLLPFFFFVLSVLLAKTRKVFPLVFFVFIGIYALWSVASVWTLQQRALSYPKLLTLAAVIESDHPNDYNVVDQLTRDNQAMALRYLLTIHGYKLHKEGDYQSAKSIYIYSQEPLEYLLKDPIYEIKSFLPFSKTKSWKIENGINIYKLEK